MRIIAYGCIVIFSLVADFAFAASSAAVNITINTGLTSSESINVESLHSDSAHLFVYLKTIDPSTIKLKGALINNKKATATANNNQFIDLILPNGLDTTKPVSIKLLIKNSKGKIVSNYAAPVNLSNGFFRYKIYWSVSSGASQKYWTYNMSINDYIIEPGLIIPTNDDEYVRFTSGRNLLDGVTASEGYAILKAFHAGIMKTLVKLNAKTYQPINLAKIIESALGRASSVDDALEKIENALSKAVGYSLLVPGDTVASGGDNESEDPPVSSVPGYLCGTTKKAGDPMWIQSHGSYWAAMSAHDIGDFTTEAKYCSVARSLCQAVVTNKADCPG